MENFTDWLEQQIKIRNLNTSAAARQVNLTPAALSRILNGTRKPGLDACIGIAQGFDIPITEIIRHVRPGSFPPISEEQEETEKLLRYFYPLPSDDRQRVITITSALYEEHAKYKTDSGDT